MATALPISHSFVGKAVRSWRTPRIGALARRAVFFVKEHVATVAAYTAIDWGCFQASAAAGWIVTGITLLLLEWKIRD